MPNLFTEVSMMLSLIGAILFPFVTSNKSASSALRGAVLGSIVACLLGLALPTKPARTVAMTPIRMQKEWVNADHPLSYSINAMDENHRVRYINCGQSETSICVSSSNEVKVYECRTTFQHNWMWVVGFCCPFTSYEIEVPNSMATAMITAPRPSDPIVLYNDDLNGNRTIGPVLPAVATNTK